METLAFVLWFNPKNGTGMAIDLNNQCIEFKRDAIYTMGEIKKNDVTLVYVNKSIINKNGIPYIKRKAETLEVIA